MTSVYLPGIAGAGDLVAEPPARALAEDGSHGLKLEQIQAEVDAKE